MTAYEIVQYEDELPSFRDADPDVRAAVAMANMEAVLGRKEPRVLHTFDAETYNEAHTYWKRWVEKNVPGMENVSWQFVVPNDGFAKGINRDDPEG